MLFIWVVVLKLGPVLGPKRLTIFVKFKFKSITWVTDSNFHCEEFELKSMNNKVYKKAGKS